MVDTNMENELKNKIIAEKEEAHDETIWGKPANDIINGIGKNVSVKPQRAIWEMVQNARDVANNQSANISFIRETDAFVFQHDGVSFTNKTLEALILQTSSKNSNNKAEVGQYGTGFLTTHKLGLKFELSGSVRLLEGESKFHHFNQFLVDRSSTIKKEMRDSLKSQLEETKKWAEKPTIVDEPAKLTTFRYIQEHDVEKKNTKEAFATSPMLVPYVIALNPSLNSIRFIDDVDGSEVTYKRKNIESVRTNDLYEQIKVTVTEHFKEDKDYIIHMLRSCERDEVSGEHKVVVILPLNEEQNRVEAFAFPTEMPNLYIFLPLLGTGQWGLNYLLHSPLFTCDNDSRDSLRFEGNGQNNDDDADLNKVIVQLADHIICRYLNDNLSNIEDRKYLAKVAFKHNGNDVISDYYKGLQKSWVEKYEALPFVKTTGGYIETNKVKVLDAELLGACKENENFFTAIYDVIIQEYGIEILPVKEDFLYWSMTIQQWYEGETENPYQISLLDIIQYITTKDLKTIGKESLLQIDQYIVRSKQTVLFSEYNLLPTRNGKLLPIDELHKPTLTDPSLLSILENLLVNDVDSFVHTCFASLDDVAIKKYGHDEVKDSLRLLISKLNDIQKCHESYQKKICEDVEVEPGNYDKALLAEETIEALMRFYAYLINIPGRSGFEFKMLNSLAEFYELSLEEGNVNAKNFYDWRSVAILLIKDALFRFTLLNREEQEAKKDWVESIVKLLYNYSDYQSYLEKYAVYPNLFGRYCYSKQLYKQVDVKDDLLEMFDEVVGGVTRGDESNSVKHSLLNYAFDDLFVGNSTKEGSVLANRIMAEFKSEGAYPDISQNKWKQKILDIIEKQDNEEYWVSMFGDIDSSKGSILLSVVQDREKKDSIFTLIKVEDKESLKVLAECAGDENFKEVLELGRKAYNTQCENNTLNAYLVHLGSYVEEYVQDELQSELNESVVKVDVNNEQNGQDFVVRVGLKNEEINNMKPVYYLEVKSRWVDKDSVRLTSTQAKKAVDEKEHYALVQADMISYDREKVYKNIPPKVDDEDFKSRLTAVCNIGELIENRQLVEIIESANNSDDVIRLSGDWGVTVSQKVWSDDSFGKSFDYLVNQIKERVRVFLAK